MNRLSATATLAWTTLATLAVLASFALTATSAHAGPDADALGRCLVVESTSEDKLDLVKWMFTAMSQHPAVSELAQVSEQDRAVSLEGMANLMTVLLTDRCAELAKTAIRNEGPIAMQTSFATLGQVAAAELFANPQVSGGLAELDTYLDHNAINEALELGGFTPPVPQQ
ncbi:MAG: hypothetical protein PsegKO_17750 [Pseudohongiellaceae bacterium]|jgi:hypothetical protein